MEDIHVKGNPQMRNLVPINQAMKKANLGLYLQHKLSTIEFEFSGNVQLMQAGASGHPSGVSAVATVRRVEDQFHISQGQERVSQKFMEGRTVRFLRNRP